MPRFQSIPMLLCECCLMVGENGDSSCCDYYGCHLAEPVSNGALPKSHGLAPLGKLDGMRGHVALIGDDATFYNYATCDGCGVSEGGHYYAVTFMRDPGNWYVRVSGKSAVTGEPFTEYIWKASRADARASARQLVKTTLVCVRSATVVRGWATDNTFTKVGN